VSAPHHLNHGAPTAVSGHGAVVADSVHLTCDDLDAICATQPQGWALENVVVPAARLYGMESEYQYLRPSIKRFPTGGMCGLSNFMAVRFCLGTDTLIW